jgi:hypothetical protein
MKNPHRGFIVPLLLIIVALLVVGGGAYFYVHNKQANQPITASLTTQATSQTQTSNQTSPTTQSVNTISVTTIEATSTAQQDVSPIIETGYTKDYANTTPGQLVLLSPSGNQVVISKNVAAQISTQGRTSWAGEELTDGLMVVNPLNKNQIILSTQEADANNPVGGDYSLVDRIYSYDLDTNELKLLATTEDKSQPDIELAIIGSQSSKVIFISHTVGTGGPCESAWSRDADLYTYLDLNNLGAGFQKYVVPADKVQEGKADDAKCEQDLNSDTGS